MHPEEENAGYGAENFEAMNDRVEFMDMLYLADGRDNLHHPSRGLYTNLFKNYLASLPSLKATKEETDVYQGVLHDA